MAKKASDEFQEPYIRRLSKDLPGANPQKQSADTEYNEIYNQGNWRPYELYPLALICDDTIDLSGYNLQDLTFYPEIGFNQISPIYQMSGRDGGSLFDATVITTVPIDDDTLYWTIVFGGSPASPQYGNTTLAVEISPINYEQLLYCDVQYHTRNSSTPGVTGNTQLIGRSQLGSLEPTAADKLYIYRLVVPYSNGGQESLDPPEQERTDDFLSLIIPPTKVGLIGTMAKEPDIEYLMRLKRSYELANQV